MKFLFLSVFLLPGLYCFAQRQNIYFLRNDGRYVDSKDSANFIRVVREPDSASVLYNVFEFFLNNKPKLIGKSSVIDPPKFEGQCLEFYRSGKKEAVYNYKNGHKTGLQFEYFPNGKVYRTLDYQDTLNPSDEFSYDYLITANYDSLGNTLVADGNGYFKSYDPEMQEPAEEGKVVNGRKDSVWKGSLKTPALTFIENYANGKMISGYATYKNGERKAYVSRKIAPQFKGGIDAFYKYLSKNIEYPYYEKRKGIQGKVIVAFVVEKGGGITEVKVLEALSPGLDKEAQKVISKSPKWLPGYMFGEPVRVHYDIPIDFSLK